MDGWLKTLLDAGGVDPSALLDTPGEPLRQSLTGGGEWVLTLTLPPEQSHAAAQPEAAARHPACSPAGLGAVPLFEPLPAAAQPVGESARR